MRLLHIFILMPSPNFTEKFSKICPFLHAQIQSIWEVQDVPRPTGDINLGSKVVEEGLMVVLSGPLKVPFILIVLNVALKEVVFRLPIFINIAVVGRTRNIRLVKVNIQNLPDAVIRNLPFFTLSKYPKIKVLFFFCLLPPSTKRQFIDVAKITSGYQTSID